jgi:alpha-L-fucosidase
MTTYEPTWESLGQSTTPQWYLDGKFGIFIHWGVYAVPAFGNEWYPRNMYIRGTKEYEHHLATYGPHTEFGYKDFIPMFRAEAYDPATWAQLFKDAGARFVVPVAEHHDGFAMYDTALSPWCAAKMGPKRDLIGELAAAVREEGLVFGLSSHRAEHWWFMNGGMQFASDVQDPAYRDFYGPAQPHDEEWRSKDWRPRPHAKFLDDWLARTCELVDKYQPKLVWFDWWIEQTVFAPYLQKFAAYYYNQAQAWRLGATINYKHEAFPADAAVYDIERGQLNDINPRFWQTDTSISRNSWGYVSEQDYKSARDVIGDLVDIVSKNGALLLNIGPRSDGTIPEPEVETLQEIGRWLKVNGDAIYGTRPWRRFGEGPTDVAEGYFTDTQRTPFTSADIRFTTKGDTLYAICLGWPEHAWRLESLSTGTGRVATVDLLGSEASLAWTQDAEGLTVKAPPETPCDHAYTLRITFQREAA